MELRAPWGWGRRIESWERTGLPDQKDKEQDHGAGAGASDGLATKRMPLW